MNHWVIVPWRDTGCPWRRRALRAVTDQWSALGFRVALGMQRDDGPWVKAHAVADGIVRTAGRGASDVVVVADADVICYDTIDAVNRVNDGRAWAVPHHLVFRLNRDATTAMLDGTEMPDRMYEQTPYRGIAGGGLVVIRRDVWADCPLDARFAGWGQEDESWGTALTTLFGPPWRGPADLVHLWHPPQSRMNRVIGSHAGRQLRGRYRAAAGIPAQMRALIGERGVRND